MKGNVPLPMAKILKGLPCLALSHGNVSFVPHSFQFTPPIEVTISILELSHGDLLIHPFNPMAPNDH